MAEQGTHKIYLLWRLYVIYQLIADTLFAAASAGLAGCLMYAIYSLSWWWSVLFFVILLALITGIRRSWRVNIKTITSFLNLKYPDLEESSELALKQPDELNVLEKLQLTKVETVLETVPNVQKEFAQRLKLNILILLIVTMFGMEITQMHDYWRTIGFKLFEPTTLPSKNTVPEKTLPQVESVSITIAPPNYTNKPRREQDKFTLEVEEGSIVTWKLKLNVPAKEVLLLFSNHEKINLENKNGDATYYGQKKIDKPGFYQVIIDGKLSDLYPVQVIKDNPPVIHIKTPSQYTYIDAGEAPKVSISAAVDDDYGISNAFIYATVAKGSGEAVKFKEQKIDFTTTFDGHDRHYDLQKLINLPSLNMEPGDELYFYIQAQDTHNQQSRTDVYIVAIQDTAQLLSMDGLLSGVNVKPEYFRSERQIILDSQTLLRERDSISKEAFNNRSNDLGTDQKLLRLRYGKFLGEESESDIDPKDDKNDPVGDIKNYGNAAVILDKYTDKHDNAEDAQFFDPAIKAQLKATLTEMWKAELQLRLYKPDAALPFEYKALRLLKDLQQKSRMYVAKTAYNPSPLKMEKRMTGDLTKIMQPVNHQDIKTDNSPYEALKNVVGILEQLKTGDVVSGADLHSLQLANQQLSEKASAQPEIYLSAVSALRRILSAGKIKYGDVALVEKAIQRILPVGTPLPSAVQNSADMGLSSGYFKNLNHK
ncbi:MAG: hypothetical protein JWP37_2204 [Mucilaginibacter sp.]|nr:hypothetical protein [Mucilaginibacter sp.]